MLPATAALRAMTLLTGFMSAESAVIGRFMGGLFGADISTMTTALAAPVSRTQMNFSLSIVRLVKEMLAALMPALVSCVSKREVKRRKKVREAMTRRPHAAAIR